MSQSEQANKAELFRAMHTGPPPLLLPNAWDAISARIVVAAGFHAIATTSGGVAWARGRAYFAAGADCVYPLGLRDPATMGRLAKALGAPININVRAGSPSVAELEALGVKRASTATAIPLMAMGLVRQLAEQLQATHRFDPLNPAMTHPEAQLLLAPREGGEHGARAQ